MPRRPKSDKAQKKLVDDARLLRAWKKFHREEREAVLTGPHGAVLVELFRMLDHLQFARPTQVIGIVNAIDWAAIDFNTRLVVLHEVNAAVMKHREKQGLEPIDDPLPGSSDNVFRVIRQIINQFPAVRGGGSPGAYPGKQVRLCHECA